MKTNRLLLSGVLSTTALESPVLADEYYSGKADCLSGKLHQVIIVKPEENTFGYYYNDIGIKYKETEFEGMPETRIYDYSETRAINVTGVAGEQISLRIMKDGEPYNACSPSVLDKVDQPDRMYASLLEIIREADHTPGDARRVYELHANLPPSNFVSQADPTSTVREASKAANAYWPAYFEANKQRIREMPLETQADLETVRDAFLSAFDPDYGGRQDYLLENKSFRRIAFETLEDVAAKAVRNELEFSPLTAYSEPEQFCLVAGSGMPLYGDHGTEVFVGLPYKFWTTDVRDQAIKALEDCNLRESKRLAEKVESDYTEFVIPQKFAWQERLKKEKTSAQMLEQIVDWTQKSKSLASDRETYIFTMGYLANDLPDDDYTKEVHEAFDAYLNVLENKRKAVRDEIESKLPERIKVSDEQLLSDDFSLTAFEQNMCGMPELADVRDPEMQQTLQSYCEAYAAEASRRRQSLFLEDLLREQDKACDTFIAGLNLSDDLTGGTFSNIRLPNGKDTIRTRDLLCQMQQIGDLSVESQGWFSGGYKVTYAVDHSALLHPMRSKTEQVLAMQTNPDSIATYTQPIAILSLMMDPSVRILEKATVAFEIEKDDDFGTWNVTKVNHSYMGKLDDKPLPDRTECAITPTLRACREL